MHQVEWWSSTNDIFKQPLKIEFSWAMLVFPHLSVTVRTFFHALCGGPLGERMVQLGFPFLVKVFEIIK